MAKGPNGFVIYEGPSALDGSPIIVVATGFSRGSANGKTGAVVQTWILAADVSPVDAVKTGADATVCGACPHRGRTVDGRNVDRSCYVTVHQAPASVWKSYHGIARGQTGTGIYPRVAAGDLPALFEGLGVRLGSYGDPAAVPSWVWSQVTERAAFWTGYTHQWRKAPREFALYCMASADSEADRDAARAMGYRIFRVASDMVRDRREVRCPASKEAGVKTACAECRACGGTSSKARADIVIMAHGSPAKIAAASRNLAALA